MWHDFCLCICAQNTGNELGELLFFFFFSFTFKYWTLTGTVKPQFILQVWSVVSFWSYFSYFDDTATVTHWHPTMFFWVSPKRESGLCACLCANVCVFFWPHMREELCSFLWLASSTDLHGGSVVFTWTWPITPFLPSMIAVLSLTPIRIFSRLLICPLISVSSSASLPGFNYNLKKK